MHLIVVCLALITYKFPSRWFSRTKTISEKDYSMEIIENGNVLDTPFAIYVLKSVLSEWK